MKTELQTTIVQEVRFLKEENAAQHGYSLEAIISSAGERQEASGRRVIRQTDGKRHEPKNP
jgi:hypothetical protein